jgi:hypothetical protein
MQGCGCGADQALVLRSRLLGSSMTINDRRAEALCGHYYKYHWLVLLLLLAFLAYLAYLAHPALRCGSPSPVLCLAPFMAPLWLAVPETNLGELGEFSAVPAPNRKAYMP